MTIAMNKDTVTAAGYAHATPSVIQSAVNKLAEPRGEVVQFARRAS